MDSFQLRRYDKMTVVDHSFKLEYNEHVNTVNIVIYEDDKQYGIYQLDLNAFKSDQIYKLWIDVISEKDNEQDLEFEIGVLWEGRKAARNDESIINHSLKRKAPERVDILNEKNINEFVKNTKSGLIRQIEFEKLILEEYYTEAQAKLMLNNKYNFVITKETNEMGMIDQDDLIDFCNDVLFSRWSANLDNVYEEFTTPTRISLENKSLEFKSILDKDAVKLLWKTMSRRNNQLFGAPNQDIDHVFSIKNFMTSLVLLSSITLGQKLDILYEIFDWDDGEGDGLDHACLKLLLNTILGRNLQYVPSNQIDNMVDLLYGGESGCITSVTYSTYLPLEGENISMKNLFKTIRKNTLDKTRGRYEKRSQFIESLDLTEAFQDILWKYHNVFGCKNLCFHPIYSPFSDLQEMLNWSKYDILLAKHKDVENLLCIVYQVNGVKRVYTAYYDGNHRLIRVDDDPDLDSEDYSGIEKILHQNKFFCDMENYPTSVSKQQFIFKSIHVPYFSDFMRSETMIRCEDFETAIRDPAEALDDILLIHLLNRKGAPMLTCKFNKSTEEIAFDPGLTSSLTDNNLIHNFIGIKRGVVIVKMSAAFKNNSLVDVEARIEMAIRVVLSEINTDNPEIEQLELDNYVWGFKKYGDGSRNTLNKEADLEEITYLEGYELVYFPIQAKSMIERRPKPILSIFDDKYDCYCLLEEIDETQQWVPCIIKGKIGNEYTVELKDREGFQIRKSRENLLFSKERMHHFEPELF